MEPGIIYLKNKRMEQSVTSISAKITSAVEMVQKAKVMMNMSENMLIKAQLELEELYIALDKHSSPYNNTNAD